MKRIICSLLFLTIMACGDDDNRLFDETADDRVEHAAADFRSILMQPDEGWKLKYRPVDGSGSYYVFIQFLDDRKVNIRTDLGADNGVYYNQTLDYRIDVAHSLELIIENYSFFSFLYELDDATFEAEFEFLFANETPDGDLVFTSKSDLSTPTILVFEEAETGEAEDVLGVEVSQNLNIMADDLNAMTSVMKLTYQDKDVAFSLSLDDVKRTIRINRAVRKSNASISQSMDFTSPYIIRGDSIVFDTKLSGTFVGSSVSLKGIKLNTLSQSQINICSAPTTLHAYEGVTSANDDVTLESTLSDVGGQSFTSANFYVSGLGDIFHNGEYVYTDIQADITGALAMQLYYDYDGFYGIGFVIQNADGSITFALREFTPVLTGNKIVFNFAPGISIFGEPDTDANVNNVNIYLNEMTEGDQTYVFEREEGVYEFFNPCTGWSFNFYDANQ